MADAQVILVVGSTGAGKTTYARKIADDLGAIRFSIDDWMVPLFGPDQPVPIRFDWMIERVRRCEAMMLTLVAQAGERGLASVLDLGFTKREHRESIAVACTEMGFSCVIHFVDVDAQTRWARVEQRNREQGETFAMHVDRGMFDFMENMWEPPNRREWQAGGGVRIDGAQ